MSQKSKRNRRGHAAGEQKKSVSNYNTASFFDLRSQKAFNIPDESFRGFYQREDRILVEIENAAYNPS